MITGACKYGKLEDTPKKLTANARTTRFANTARTMVNGPTHTSLRVATLSWDVERADVDLMFFFLYTFMYTFMLNQAPSTRGRIHQLHRVLSLISMNKHNEGKDLCKEPLLGI